MLDVRAPVAPKCGSMIGSWLIRKLLKKGFGVAVDSMGKSALERDFGEAEDDDIVVPNARFHKVMPLTQMATPLHAMFRDIDGLEVSHVARIGLRLNELPIRKEARFQYQVKDADAVVELQVTMTKSGADEIGIAFRNFNGVIGTIMRCFATENPNL